MGTCVRVVLEIVGLSPPHAQYDRCGYEYAARRRAMLRATARHVLAVRGPRSPQGQGHPGALPGRPGAYQGNLDGMGTLSPAFDKRGTICTNSRRALITL